MPRLSLGLGVQTVRKVGGGGAAPSNISLIAPTIYISGLSFQDQDPFYSGAILNPYTLIAAGAWGDASNYTGYVEYVTEWRLYVYSFNDGSAPALVAKNTALPTSLPTTGWTNTNENLIVSGTVVISTTP
jgi:hypothetical protein